MSTGPRPTSAPLRFALSPSSASGLAPEVLLQQTEDLRALLTDLLAVDVDVTVSHDDDALVRNVRAGSVDAAFAPPVACAQLAVRGGVLVASIVRGGTAVMASSLVLRSGASLRSPKNIRAAWGPRWSVTGHWLPYAHLRTEWRIDARRHFAQQVHHDSEAAALTAVVNGAADLCALRVGTLDESAEREVLQRRLGDAAEVRLQELTSAVPHDGVVVRPGGDPLAWHAAMLHLHQEPAAAALLSTLFRGERFDDVPDVGYAALAPLAS